MNKNTQFVLIAGGMILFIGFLIKQQAQAAVQGVQDINVGTPFEGAGAVGTLGNFFNQLSGGVFARVGSAIGGGLATVREGLGGITQEREASPDAIEEQIGVRAG